jgi:hypothetical protein
MSRVHQNCPSCTCQDLELTNTGVFKAVSPTALQLAEHREMAQSLEMDREFTRQQSEAQSIQREVA